MPHRAQLIASYSFGTLFSKIGIALYTRCVHMPCTAGSNSDGSAYCLQIVKPTPGFDRPPQSLRRAYWADVITRSVGGHRWAVRCYSRDAGKRNAPQANIPDVAHEHVRSQKHDI